jgi:hypothetical protein
LANIILLKKGVVMALPIAATPTLEGNEALRFWKDIEENENKRLPAEEVRRSVDIFNAVMKKNPHMQRQFSYAAN